MPKFHAGQMVVVRRIPHTSVFYNDMQGRTVQLLEFLLPPEGVETDVEGLWIPTPYFVAPGGGRSALHEDWLDPILH